MGDPKKTKKPITEIENPDLAYELAKEHLERIQDNLSSLTTKITATIAASVLLLRFAAELPTEGWIGHVRASICVLLGISIAVGGWALIPVRTKYAFSVESLLYPNYQDSQLYEDRLKTRVAKTWNEAIKELGQRRERMARWFSVSISLEIVSIILAAICTAWTSYL